jgi:hypothetical protein
MPFTEHCLICSGVLAMRQFHVTCSFLCSLQILLGRRLLRLFYLARDFCGVGLGRSECPPWTHTEDSYLNTRLQHVLLPMSVAQVLAASTAMHSSAEVVFYVSMHTILEPIGQ